MSIEISSIGYLNDGSTLQKVAYDILTTLEVFEKLAEDQPALVGSVPLDLALDLGEGKSGIDLVTSASDLRIAAQRDRSLFSDRAGFQCTRGIFGGVPSVITQFQFESIPVHVVTQALPTPVQSSVIHLLVQYRLLQLGGPPFRSAILERRRQGQSLESAVAQLLNLDNVYQELLDFDDLTDHELRERFGGRLSHHS